LESSEGRSLAGLLPSSRDSDLNEVFELVDFGCGFWFRGIVISATILEVHFEFEGIGEGE